MQDPTIAFIGGGNMTQAIVQGLLADGYDAAAISIAEPNRAQRETLSALCDGVNITEDNEQAASRSAVIVFAVKPQIVATVCRDLRSTVFAKRPLLVPIAAGVRSADIDRWVGGNAAVARIMPNQPALIRQGVSGLFANSATSKELIAIADRIMSSVGAVVHVDRESDIDSVTAISGSGPAYFFLLIAMLEEAAVAFGLEPDKSRQLAVSTAIGAASLAATSDKSLDDLIASVRSPGGTTAAALESLDSEHVRDIFQRAFEAARNRAVEMADSARNAT